jgi:hypothetical protein
MCEDFAMRARVRSIVLAVAMLELTTSLALAGPTFYSTRATYNAATTGNTSINFEGIAPDNGFLFEPTPPGITLSGVNFTIDHTNNNGTLFVIGDDFFYTGTSVLSSELSTTGPDNILITLPKAAAAFAVDFGNFAQTPVTFTLSTGDTFTEPTSAFPDFVFLGVVNTAPFTSILISQPINDALNLADFTFGLPVPEPSTLAMGAVSLLAGLVHCWRTRARDRP